MQSDASGELIKIRRLPLFAGRGRLDTKEKEGGTCWEGTCLQTGCPVGTVPGPGRNAAPGAHLLEHVGRLRASGAVTRAVARRHVGDSLCGGAKLPPGTPSWAGRCDELPWGWGEGGGLRRVGCGGGAWLGVRGGQRGAGRRGRQREASARERAGFGVPGLGLACGAGGVKGGTGQVLAGDTSRRRKRLLLLLGEGDGDGRRRGPPTPHPASKPTPRRRARGRALMQPALARCGETGERRNVLLILSEGEQSSSGICQLQPLPFPPLNELQAEGAASHPIPSLCRHPRGPEPHARFLPPADFSASAWARRLYIPRKTWA